MRGILQVDHAYIEAAQTLGASSEWKILRYVTLPSVLPCLFQGMISGMRAACGSLMIAEMMGVESGLAWYITWQRRLGQFYENVYSDRYDLHYIFIRRCGAGPAPQADFTLGGECRCLIPEVDQ